jgi:hypothetical protein
MISVASTCSAPWVSYSGSMHGMGGIYYDLCCIKCFVGQYTKYMKMYSMRNIQMTPCN